MPVAATYICNVKVRVSGALTFEKCNKTALEEQHADISYSLSLCSPAI